jgi:hypothetical protein
MEIVGEFLSFDTDKEIWKYFKAHPHSWFANNYGAFQTGKEESKL